jgi:GAF domain-containing protein
MNRRVLVVGERAAKLAQMAASASDVPLSVTPAYTGEEALRRLDASEIPFDVALIDGLPSGVNENGVERRAASYDRRGNANIELMAAIHSRSKVTDLLLVSQGRPGSIQATLRTEAFSGAGGFTDDQLADLLQRRTHASYNESDATTRLSHLLSVAASVSSSLELDEVLRGACWAATDLLRAPHAAIALFAADLTSGAVKAEHPAFGARGTPVAVLDVPAAMRIIESGLLLEIPRNELAVQLGILGRQIDISRVASMLIAPIRVRSRVIGCMAVSVTRQARRFRHDERVLCEGLASLAGVAVENSRLYHEARKRGDQLETLRRTTMALTEYVDREELLRRIIRGAVGLVQASGGGIYSYDAVAGTLTIAADHQRPEHLGRTLRVGEGLAGELVRTQSPFVVEPDYRNSPRRASSVFPENSFGSVLEVLLTWENQVTGVLYVDDVAGRAFGEDDIQLLRLHAEQAAVALAHNSASPQPSPIQAAAEILDLGVTELDQRLAQIASLAAHLLTAESAGVFLVPEPGVLSLEASFGHSEGRFDKGKRLLIRPNAGLTGHIAFEGKPFREHGDRLIRHHAVRNPQPRHLAFGTCCSLVALPLFTRVGGERRLKALLRLENKLGADGRPSPHVGFTDADEQALRLFGEFVTIAIANAELVAALRDKQERSDRRNQIAGRMQGVMARLQPDQDLKALQRALVRDAVDLIDGSAACLYAYHSVTAQLELLATVGLPPTYQPGRLHSLDELELIGRAARDPDGRLALAPDGTPGCDVGGQLYQTVFAVPLGRGREADFVLVVAGNSSHHRFADIENDMVRQLATFATTLFGRSALRSSPQKVLERGDALGRFAAFIQKTETEEKLLAALATAATAGYALGFNRAAVLLTCPFPDVLVGVMGIGDVSEGPARRAWNDDVLTTASQYLHHLETVGHIATPLDPRIRALRLELSESPDFRSLLVRARQAGSVLLESGQIESLPPELLEALDGNALRIERPLVIVPLESSDVAVGFLLADRLFTPREAIPPDRIVALARLSNQAAESIMALRRRRDGADKQGPQTPFGPSAFDNQAIAAELADLRNEVVRTASQFLQAKSAVLWCLDRTDRTWSIQAWVGVGKEHQAEFEKWPPTPGHTADTVIKTGWLAVPEIGDEAATPFLPSFTRGLLQRIGTRSFQAVSVVLGSEVLGVLYLNYHEPREFTERDREDAVQVAQQSALMLKMADTIGQLNRAYERLRALFGVASLGLLVSKWKHDVSSTAAKLRDMICNLEPGPGWEEQRRVLLDRVGNLAQSHDVKGLFDGVCLVDIDRLIVETLAPLEADWRVRGLGLTWSSRQVEPSVVRANEGWLKVALMHFVNNAMHALLSHPRTGRQGLSVSVDRRDRLVSVTFADTGPGIPAKVRNDVFVNPTPRSNPLSFGLGMMTARTILVAYNGDAQVLTSDPSGTTIRAWLPIATENSINRVD